MQEARLGAQDASPQPWSMALVMQEARWGEYAAIRTRGDARAFIAKVVAKADLVTGAATRQTTSS
jgi:hypothetical protein